ncbi:unnamed protein product [Larinioides sclopetarius]|uniref:CCHC-type domain-containing protein n=1 Tax=Larinioides sclopetarius TaxID=280406 RepID=A0AAV2AC67_9ARAC
MSPFLVNKLIISTIGEVADIKKLRSGDLLIETNSKKQATTLSKLSTLGTWPVSVSLHKTLNFSRGVISEQTLVQHSDNELQEELKSQGVCVARRILIRRNGQLIPTKHVVLTFENPILPKYIKAGYLRCNVRPYIPNPLRCFQCQRYGHSRQSCRGKPSCAKCAATDHDTSSCTSDSVKCVNCANSHPAYSKSCPKWQMEKEILALKIKNHINFAEARQIVNDRMPKPGVSYSSVLKSQLQPLNTSASETQTYELLTKVVCPPLKKLQPLRKPTLTESASPTVSSAKPQTITPKNVQPASASTQTSKQSTSTTKPSKQKDTSSLIKSELPKNKKMPYTCSVPACRGN